MWGEPSREIGYGNGDPIEPFTDQSGNSRHWTHTGGDETLPRYEENVLNGLAVADGDHVGGNEGWNTGPDMSSLTAVHAFVIMKAKADPAGDIGQTGLWNMGTDALAAHVPYVDGVIYDDAFSNARKTTGNPDTNMASAFVLYEVISTSTEWTRKINGATSGNDHFTTGTNTVAGPVNPTLLFNVGATSRHKLAGLYICSAKLDSTDRTTLVTYINDRFNTSYS